MKSTLVKKEDAKRDWVLIDLKDKTLGRAATRIADILRGKNKPVYTPHTDTGDFVVAINASHVKLSGNKWQKKMYHSHSGYMGGLKSVTAEELMAKHPEDLIIKAVKGMLPKNYLNKTILKKLKVYPGEEHPHSAQGPKEIKLN